MKSRAILRALVVVALTVPVACSDSAGPAVPAFAVSPPAQWSGGAITIRSSYFANRVQAAILVADGDTLALTAVDDSTVTASLPQGPSGEVTVALARGSRLDDLASVHRVGYSDTRNVTSAGFARYGALQAADSAGNPLVFGAAATSPNDYRARIVRLKVVAGTTTLFGLRQPDKTFYGMAPSVTPGVFAVRDSTDTLRMARLIDDPPSVLGTAAIRFASTRQVSQLSDSIWLRTASHYTETFLANDTSGVSLITTAASESPYAVFLSPRRDRATLWTRVNGTEGGVPVFDNAAGTLAYRLPFWYVRGAAFSPDGGTLYVAGGQYSADSLVAVDATTGTVQIPGRKLPGGLYATGLAYRSGDQLLVGASDEDFDPPTPLFLLVYRASDLQLLGVLPSPFECGEPPTVNRCVGGALTIDHPHNRAYIVISDSPIPIVAFDLLGPS